MHITGRGGGNKAPTPLTSQATRKRRLVISLTGSFRAFCQLRHLRFEGSSQMTRADGSAPNLVKCGRPERQIKRALESPIAKWLPSMATTLVCCGRQGSDNALFRPSYWQSKPPQLETPRLLGIASLRFNCHPRETMRSGKLRKHVYVAFDPPSELRAKIALKIHKRILRAASRHVTGRHPLKYGAYIRKRTEFNMRSPPLS